ncbi:MAG TPA: hypothetical protein VFB54_18855 [Burkholderiales bacterium]|nr:hypothetical protein [Burkholderiales bacterium]
MRVVAASLFLACAMTGQLVFAAEQKPYADIPVHKQSGIDYVSGGMTPEEKHEIQRIANKYPMQMVFTAEGEPPELKGVQVKVKDLKGNVVLEAEAQGPFFYFNPPSGRWTMEAQYKGETVSRTVDLIGRRYIVLPFHFKGSGG